MRIIVMLLISVFCLVSGLVQAENYCDKAMSSKYTAVFKEGVIWYAQHVDCIDQKPQSRIAFPNKPTSKDVRRVLGDSNLNPIYCDDGAQGACTTEEEYRKSHPDTKDAKIESPIGKIPPKPPLPPTPETVRFNPPYHYTLSSIKGTPEIDIWGPFYKAKRTVKFSVQKASTVKFPNNNGGTGPEREDFDALVVTVTSHNSDLTKLLSGKFNNGTLKSHIMPRMKANFSMIIPDVHSPTEYDDFDAAPIYEESFAPEINGNVFRYVFPLYHLCLWKKMNIFTSDVDPEGGLNYYFYIAMPLVQNLATKPKNNFFVLRDGRLILRTEESELSSSGLEKVYQTLWHDEFLPPALRIDGVCQ